MRVKRPGCSRAADLNVLTASEQSYDPANGEKSTSVEVTRAGERAGSTLEQRFDLQLPYLRSDSQGRCPIRVD